MIDMTNIQQSEDMFTVKELLKTMFEGWIIQEKAQEKRGEETQPPQYLEKSMVLACGGDELKGELLTLFSHWDNDIVSLAAHYGIGLARKQPDGSLLYEDGTIDTLLLGGELTVTEVPPAPSTDHYWHAGVWNAPMQDAEGMELG